MPRIYITTPPEERLWRHVNKDGPIVPTMRTRCWVWTAAVRDGYGQYKLGTGKWDRAHRVSFIAHGGILQQEQCVLHRCDNDKNKKSCNHHTASDPDDSFHGFSSDCLIRTHFFEISG